MNDYVKKKTFGTVSGLPKFQRDDSSPNGFSAMEPKEERTFSSMLDKYKKTHSLTLIPEPGTKTSNPSVLNLA